MKYTSALLRLARRIELSDRLALNAVCVSFDEQLAPADGVMLATAHQYGA